MTERLLLSLGHGYSARALARRLGSEWQVIGTTRTEEKAARLTKEGITARIWPGTDLSADIAAATHVLASAGPGSTGDPFLPEIAGPLRKARPVWVGYLSTTGVYGDHGGAWVDEDTPLVASTERGARRVEAEQAWQALADAAGWPLHIFRLAGIYGPGRGPFAKVARGEARRIVKPGQVFSRIHVDDIAQVLDASIAAPVLGGRAYNLCDDEPAPPQDVLAYAAELLGVPAPPEVPFENAALSPMARSFYAENKRVRNDRIKGELGVRLLYPTYREGLQALRSQELAESGE
ncbi:MAG: SDR family oxidoreductase [Pseudomonadota bacterium]